MSIASFISEIVWNLGTRALAFSRRQTPEQVLREAATWEHNHMGIGPYNDQCATCGQRGVNANERCPGPPATQAARRKLEAREKK